ncbi:MAG TPA: SDR family oxidoreductase [Solirubrobacteraceae bacterium]|jgi:NAD(P)-dependent dehydrogenase (short-subunit alcohol dehydrogenase family)|nr:SDR family oxidoreductase [Solirubrobacteraceae bacterium]
MNAKPQVVVVTGASGGVGRAIAHAFAKRGAHIGLLARGREGLDGAAREVESFGGRALAVPTDVSEHAQVEAAAVAVERRFGEIDVWVNDAMATVFARFIDTEPEEFKRATEVTYLGTVYGTMVALARMTARDRGKIVQVGSALSYRAIPLQAAYCGAKFGIRGFTDSIRTELRHDKSKVQITMVQLPGVNTTQFSWCRSKLPDHPMPVPPIYQPEIPAEAVYWAAQHRRRELWVGYSAVEAILGSRFAPGVLGDLYLAKTGISGQQVKNMPIDGGRVGNLFAPVEGDAATHGIFDAKAKTRSPQLWAATHRGALAAGLAGAAAAAVVAAKGLAR